MTNPENDAGRVEALRQRRQPLEAIIFTVSGALKVRVNDISTSHARVWAGSPVAKECDAIFKKDHVFAAARIIWTKGQEACLEFYRELKPDEARFLANRLYHNLAAVSSRNATSIRAAHQLSFGKREPKDH